MTAPPEDWLKSDKLMNWAGCYEFTVKVPNLHMPKTVSEVQELVKRVSKIRVLGTRHCFHGIADCPSNMLWTVNLDQIHHIDLEKRQVTVGPGIRYGQLAEILHEKGLALKNMASLPHISIGGACATATHGSGMKNGCLSTHISEIELVKGDGEVVHLTRGVDTDFEGILVGLGGFGIVTKLTIDLVPSYDMSQIVYMDLSMSVLKENFEKIMSSGYSVSLFTKWQNKTIDQVWIKSVVDPKKPNGAEELDLRQYGAKRLNDVDVHPIIELAPVHCTEQKGVIGSWKDRLPHFKLEFMPGAGVELQTEYFVPFEHSYDAIMTVESFGDQIEPLIWCTEIRIIEADDLWLSPFYKQRCTAIHFTWKQEIEPVRALMRQIEDKLKPFKAKPHWGKLFEFSSDYLESVHPRMQDFRELLKKYDPEGKFRNEFMDRHIFGRH